MIGWSLYIIRCSDNSLYTGIAKDVGKRFNEHQGNGPKCSKYLRGRGPLSLVFEQYIGSRSEALKIEGRVKQLTKARKEKILIDPVIIQHLMKTNLKKVHIPKELKNKTCIIREQ